MAPYPQLKEKKATQDEIVNAITTFCLQNEQPIPRGQMMKIFKLEKIDLVRMEKQKLIYKDYFHKRSNTKKQPWVVAYFPAKYEELLKKKNEFVKTQTQKAKEQMWTKVNWVIRVIHWIIKTIGMKKVAQKIYNKKNGFNICLRTEHGAIT